MGWERTLLLGDIGNRLDIEDTERDIRGLRDRIEASARTDRAQDQRLARLEQENDQLKLYLASLARLLVSKKVLDAAELERFVKVIDTDSRP